MTAWVVSVRGMSESIIETHNLTKRFAKATTNSVTDLNFAVQQGEMVAFLGPNGAGKNDVDTYAHHPDRALQR